AEEAACDRAVVRALPRHARAYAEGLLKAVELASYSRMTPALATGAADSRELKERIMAIFHPAPHADLPRWRRALALVPLLAAVSLTPAWVQRDDAPAPPDAPDPPEMREMPAALRLRMTAPPALPAPERIPMPTAPRALSAPSVLRRMTTRIPATEREVLRAELEHRRKQLEIQRELTTMHVRQREMDTAYAKVARARDLAVMGEQLEMLERSGQKREAEELRRALDLERDQLERDAALRKVETLHGREQQELELEAMAAELRHEEAILAEDEAAIEKAEREVRALHLRQRQMDLESMRLELERTRSDLEAQQAAYERMLREVGEAPEAGQDESAAGDGTAD
ncbi:hypothetical protein K8I85_18180, partial [bacterium]|nr:hypothetical protein [bacterium]